MVTRREWLAGAGGFMAGAAGAATAKQAPASRPNILIFLVDDMGYADLGCYGSPDIRTPRIDRLARQGVRMTQFYSNGPVCTPTRAALMTGRWQQRVGLEWALTLNQKKVGLPVSEVSLPRLLKNAGYATSLFGKWHLGQEPEFSPIAHGFDTFFGIKSGNVDHYSHRYRTGEPDLWEGDQLTEREGYLTDLLAERAAAWITGKAKSGTAAQPFFSYVAFNSVHWPFQPPGRPQDVRDARTWLDGTRADYVRMVESVDTAVGRILDALDQSGLASNTLVVFTDDNGGERLSDNRPFFHHKQTVWEGGIRVPCIWRWPGRLPAGKTSAQVGITMDITASALAAAGASTAAGRSLDGIDLTPVLAGQAPPKERTLYWRVQRTERRQKAIRQGDWKYVSDGGVDLLFDLKSDPGERTDLWYHHQGKGETLRKLLLAWEDELARTPPPFVVR